MGNSNYTRTSYLMALFTERYNSYLNPMPSGLNRQISTWEKELDTDDNIVNRCKNPSGRLDITPRRPHNSPRLSHRKRVSAQTG